MKVGDLVRPGDNHGLRRADYRSHGLVIENIPKSKGFKEAVVVRWNDGDIEMEVPGWLEVISESR
jgi:hypothetical protein